MEEGSEQRYPDFFRNVYDFYKNKRFCDLRILPAGNVKLEDSVPSLEDFPCHKLVLCSALPELKNIVSSNGEDEVHLVLDGVTEEDVKTMLEEMYGGLVSYDIKFNERHWRKMLGLDSMGTSTKSEDEISVSEEGSDKINSKMTYAEDSIKKKRKRSIRKKNKENEEKEDSDSDYFDDKKPKKRRRDVKVEEDFDMTEDLGTKSSKKVRVKLLEQYCPYCLKSFPTVTNKDRSVFMEHKRTHFTCDCKIRFKYFKTYEDHMNKKHNVNIYKCDQPGCTSYYRRLQDLNNHKVSRHISSKEESNVCPTCGRIFTSAYYMKSHYVSIHTKMKCKICGIISNGSNGNQKHHLECHQVPIVCDQCGKTFRCKKNLRIHIINVHTADKDRPFQCKLCPRGFLDNTKLYDHVARDHEGRRQYPCRSPGCTQAFTLTGVRKKHEKRAHKLTIDLRKGSRSKEEITPGFHQENPITELEMKTNATKPEDATFVNSDHHLKTFPSSTTHQDLVPIIYTAAGEQAHVHVQQIPHNVNPSMIRHQEAMSFQTSN